MHRPSKVFLQNNINIIQDVTAVSDRKLSQNSLMLRNEERSSVIIIATRSDIV